LNKILILDIIFSSKCNCKYWLIIKKMTKGEDSDE
jgi:hypothetical protein